MWGIFLQLRLQFNNLTVFPQQPLGVAIIVQLKFAVFFFQAP